MRFSPGCHCCACGSIAVTVRLCSDNSLVSGATVTVKDGGGATVGSGTTSGTGVVSVDIPAAGTYEVVVVKSGQPTVTLLVAADCGTRDLVVHLGRTLVGVVGGCNIGFGFLPGAAVTAVLGDVSYSTVTGSSGAFSLAIAEPGVYTVTVSKARFVARVFTPTVSASPFLCSTHYNGGVTAQLLPASGYRCFTPDPDNVAGGGYNCIDPIPETLHLTDSVYGAVTLTYTAVGTPGWAGTRSVSYGGGCGGCGAATVTATYLFRQSGGYPGTLSISYPASPFGGCPGGAGTASLSAFATAHTCPPAFSMTFGYGGFAGGAGQPLYCSAVTFTLTE